MGRILRGAPRPRDSCHQFHRPQNVADLWLFTALLDSIIPAYGTDRRTLRRSVFLPGIYGTVALLFGLVGVAMQRAASRL